MKHYEELARMRVEEAIHAGLRSQSAHRALSENKPVASPPPLAKVRQHASQELSQGPWFVLLLNRIINIAR